MLGRENLLSREEVTRLQGLRGTYGIKAPAPICADPSALGRLPVASDGDLSGGAGALGAGQRLVPESSTRAEAIAPSARWRTGKFG